MARIARVFGDSGYMHVYTRGKGKQVIFADRADYIHYLNLLKKYSSETRVTICAFCLMGNHVHLLVYDPERNITNLMQKLNSAYAGYFNWKYKRSGHLFEGRFHGIPIESEAYLLTVFRYILNNPKSANICETEKYLWNSYSRYGKTESFVDTSEMQKLIGSWEEYESFIAAKYEDCPELEENSRSDNWAKAVMRDVLCIKSGTELQSYETIARNNALRLLKSRGVTDKQIERLTGIRRSVIENAGNVDTEDVEMVDVGTAP